MVSQNAAVPVLLPTQIWGRGWGHNGFSGKGPGLEVRLGEEAGAQCHQQALPTQSPQYPIPGAVVPGCGTIHHRDIRQRQDHLQLW